MKLIIRGIVALVVILLVLSGIAYYGVITYLDEKVFQEEVIIDIKERSSTEEIIEQFNNKSALSPAWFFKYYIRLYGLLKQRYIFAGVYRFESGTTNRRIISLLHTSGNQYIVKVTFPEGIRQEDFARILKKKLGISESEFLGIIRSPQFKAKYSIIGVESETAEGYLMPNTFEFYHDAKAEKIVDKLVRSQMEYLNSIYVATKGSGLSKHQVLTLASIIEAEAIDPEEMPRISGVYHNRLARNMLLQADPTVLYAVGKSKGITQRDLQSDNAYNTYRYPGLPPGPIGSPGKRAILAALNPEKHSYIYFVAVGDKSGKHNFSKSLAEHNAFVRKYRNNLKNATR